MDGRVRDVLLAVALLVAFVALGASFTGPDPWEELARSRGVETAFLRQQVQSIASQIPAASADERARFADCLRLLQNLGAAVEMPEGPERDVALEEAIGQAKDRIREWSQ